MRALFILATTMLLGVTIGLEATGRLEPFLEPILVYFSPNPKPLDLVPVDFDPFDPCLWGNSSPHDLCV